MSRGWWLSVVIAGCTANDAPADRPIAPLDAPPAAAAPAQAKPAAPPDFLGAWSVCRQVVGDRDTRCTSHWTEACNQALLAAAYRVTDAPAHTGTCYYHDRKSCPDCACPYYLKVGEIGFDGGTGCLQDLEALTRELRLACAAQRCEP